MDDIVLNKDIYNDLCLDSGQIVTSDQVCFV